MDSGCQGFFSTCIIILLTDDFKISTDLKKEGFSEAMACLERDDPWEAGRQFLSVGSTWCCLNFWSRIWSGLFGAYLSIAHFGENISVDK